MQCIHWRGVPEVHQEEWCEAHYLSSSPSCKCLAERFVQSFKQSMKVSGKEGTLLPQKVANFLLAYRNTAHATTGQTPVMLFMGRNLRSCLDLLKPDICKHVLEKQCTSGQTQKQLRTFSVEHIVLPETIKVKTRNGSWERFCHSRTTDVHRACRA